MSAVFGGNIRGILRVLGIASLSAWCVSCEDTTGEPAKDYGEFRLNNKSGVVTTLSVGGELRLEAGPGELKKTRTPPGLVEVTIRTAEGKTLWSQMAEVPDNAFAQFNVQSDLSVILTAGNIAKPYEVGSNKQQVRLINQASYAVEFLIDDAVIGSVGPYLYATYNVPKDTITIKFRKQGGQVLFAQTIDVPRNAFFAYTVLPNGNIIATGGEVTSNVQEQPYAYYGW